ncbi:hypothetical protein CMQ_7173 [Grosmannia clavigera kw1407]|uniref:Uncharacterized protein n=1 Tax=Grosmannia clavigera (strain kw1407 / UAMH 11150) TaxID=655863 RepID=F0XQB7_GROCL|nr:uncharacterized protein CMQ_7173 [Grosmannia clavigera kw1407]EFX00171.1 hypothetical protein CMQ_7173 [Grosmannia clavigera kw1407]
MSFNNNMTNNGSPTEDIFGEFSFNDISSSPYAFALPEVSPATPVSAQRYALRSGKVAQAAPSEEPITRTAIITQSQGKSNPPPKNAKVSHSRNKFSGSRITDYEWYDRFPVRSNWKAGHVQIRYTGLGELRPTLTFERDTLLAYVHGCREQSIPLRFWIQNPPTMQKERYMTQASHLCRYIDCPVPSRTIMRGMLQVSMDEHPTATSNGQLDPFFTAGCFHLHCLEEMIALPELMQVADVEADVRDLPLEEKNPMSLNREERLSTAYSEWKAEHFDQYVRRGLAIPTEQRRKQRLVWYLMHKKVQYQPSTRQRKRQERRGNDLTKHWGDLHKFVALNMKARQQKKDSTAATLPKRRRAHDSYNGRSGKRACFDEPSPSLLGWPSPLWAVPPPLPTSGMYVPYGVLPPYMASAQTFYPYPCDSSYSAAPYDFQHVEPFLGSGQLNFTFFDAEAEKGELEWSEAQLAGSDLIIDPLLLQQDLAAAMSLEGTPLAQSAISTDDLVSEFGDLLVDME